MSTTTIIDFAEMLRESLEAKINEFRLDMRGSYSLKEAGLRLSWREFSKLKSLLRRILQVRHSWLVVKHDPLNGINDFRTRTPKFSNRITTAVG
jgi:hypothetical protein